jgi:hypothetical protein
MYNIDGNEYVMLIEQITFKQNIISYLNYL